MDARARSSWRGTARSVVSEFFFIGRSKRGAGGLDGGTREANEVRTWVLARRPAVLATAWVAERVKADIVIVLYRGELRSVTSRSAIGALSVIHKKQSWARFCHCSVHAPMSLASRLAALVPTSSRAARSTAHHRRGIRAMASTTDNMSFVGRWTRDGSRSVNAEAYLMSHGLDAAKAAERAVAPYEQEWRETGAEEGEFLVLTDPGTGRGVRSLVYPIGEWEEEFGGKSELFGDGEFIFISIWAIILTTSCFVYSPSHRVPQHDFQRDTPPRPRAPDGERDAAGMGNHATDAGERRERTGGGQVVHTKEPGWVRG